MSEVTELLAQVPMFAGLDRKHLDKLAKDFSERVFKPGTVVVREGDEHGIGFFVVADGEAVVTVKGQEVARLHRGQSFGEVALASDRVRTATVTADGELRTLVMTLWDFRSIVKSDADIAWNVIEHLAGILHSKS